MNIDSLLKEIKKIHFIGIGGSGMCPIAEILHSWGYDISGSDNNDGDNITKLRELGMKVILGQKPENLEGAELIVYTDAILKIIPSLWLLKTAVYPALKELKFSVQSQECIQIASLSAALTARQRLLLCFHRFLLKLKRIPLVLSAADCPLLRATAEPARVIFLCAKPANMWTLFCS